jgi:hypothetical protein
VKPLPEKQKLDNSGCEKMTKHEKENKITGIVKTAHSYISSIITASLFHQIIQGTERVMDNVEGRVMNIQKNIQGKILATGVICFGAVFLILSLLFYLKEFLHWNNTFAFFSIGITIFVIGLILQLGGSSK